MAQPLALHMLPHGVGGGRVVLEATVAVAASWCRRSHPPFQVRPRCLDARVRIHVYVGMCECASVL